MNVSFNGMRKNATSSMNSLQQKIQELFDEDKYSDIDDDLKKELAESFNEAAQSVDIFNRLSDDSVEDDFDELDIDIKRFETGEDDD